jgi:hypothetical protein
VESCAKTRVGDTAKESTTIQHNRDTNSLRLGIEVILHFQSAGHYEVPNRPGRQTCSSSRLRIIVQTY